MSNQHDLNNEFRSHVREALGPPTEQKSLEDAMQVALDNLDPKEGTKPLTGKETKDLQDQIRSEVTFEDDSDPRGSDASKWF